MQITERQKYTLNTAAGLAGGTASYVWCPAVAGRIYGNYFAKQSSKFTSAEQDEYWNAAKIAYRQNPLLNNKVTVTDINLSNWARISTDLAQKRKQQGCDKKGIFRRKISDEEFKESLRVYARGRNACYYPCFSQVLVNKEKKANAVFHELGHAINSKGSGFKNLLANTRGKAVKLMPFVFGISMLTPKNREENPENNNIYKALLLFKKYSGLILSACMLPMVMEEGMASINAKKLGKEVLSPELYKKMNNMNLKAFCSYFLLMVFAGAGLTFANYVKDKITGPMPEKTKTADDISKIEAAEITRDQTETEKDESQSAES